MEKVETTSSETCQLGVEVPFGDVESEKTIRLETNDPRQVKSK